MICRYHGNALSGIVKKKMRVAHLHLPANMWAKFHFKCFKNVEVVQSVRFPPIFCHNMPLPWQRTFCHCRKTSLANLHPKANICVTFHGNCLKGEEVVSDARSPPPIFLFCHKMPLPLSATVEKCVLHIYSPRQTSVPNSIRIVQNLRK